MLPQDETIAPKEGLLLPGQRLEYILQEVPLCIIEWDTDLRVTSWNPEAEKIFGYTAAEAMGQQASFLWPAKSQAYLAWKGILGQKDSKRGIEENLTKGGQAIACEWRTTPVIANGHVAGLISFAQESSDCCSKERELHEKLQFMQVLLDAIPSPVFFKDSSKVFLGCNKAFEKMCGHKREDIVGKTVQDMNMEKDQADRFTQMDEELIKKPGVQIYESSPVVDGKSHDVLNYKATYQDDAGKVAGIVGVILDITERKRAEEALKDSQRRLSDVIDFLPDATFVIDKDGIVTAWNRATEAMTGVKAKDMIGKGNYEYAVPFHRVRRPILIDLVIKPQEAFERNYSEIQRKDNTLIGESYMPNLGGGEVYLMGMASALYDSKGNIVGAIESLRDITERKRAEDTNQQRHAREILEISTPVVQLWDGVLAVPLIGRLDGERIQQITERLLERIVETESPIAIIDLTGVPVVDTHTGRHLIETIAAVRLIGTQTLLTGIRPEIAQTLVHLGIDLSRIVTCSTLASGLRCALEIIDLPSKDR